MMVYAEPPCSLCAKHSPDISHKGPSEPGRYPVSQDRALDAWSRVADDLDVFTTIALSHWPAAMKTCMHSKAAPPQNSPMECCLCRIVIQPREGSRLQGLLAIGISKQHLALIAVCWGSFTPSSEPKYLSHHHDTFLIMDKGPIRSKECIITNHKLHQSSRNEMLRLNDWH